VLKTLARLAFGIAIALLILLLAEGILRIADYRGPSAFEDPYLGFEGIYPLFGGTDQPDGGTIYSTNSNKTRLFNYQQFRSPKPDGMFRIFCFGGSTTYGRPLKFQTAYPQWLEILLNSMDPSRRYEVINVGGISYASYRIVHLVGEAVQYQPDLFIVYSGHNEFLERRTYREILDRPTILRSLSHFMSHSRLYDLLRHPVHRYRERDRAGQKSVLPGEVDTILEHSAGLDLYSRELNQKDQTFAHYRNNLTRMTEIARRADVPIIFLSLVSNIADFSPFKSEGRADIQPEEYLAREGYIREGWRLAGQRQFERSYSQFRAAHEIDPHNAEICYLLGRTALELGRIPEAGDYLELARDEDVCPLRAPGEINSIIIEVGEEQAVPVVDLSPTFQERNRELVGHPYPGNALFFDHLHPTIEGHQLIANQIAGALIALGHVDLSPEWDPEETRKRFDDLLESLDDQYYAEGNLNLGKVLMWARKAEEALVPLRVAVERFPGNADAHYTMGTCLSKLGMSEEAIDSFGKALAIDSRNTQARNNLALEMRKTGDLQGAMREFRKILVIEPDNVKVFNNMGLISLSTGNLSEAESYFREVLDRDAENPEGYHNLGLVGMARGDDSTAEKNLRKAIDLRPNYKEALNNLAVVLLRQDRAGEAREICEEALVAFPYSPELRNNLGEIFAALDDIDSAREQFSIALSLRPGWAVALQNLQGLPPD
jgi:tetratricopeptide (TPR) repeat protein